MDRHVIEYKCPCCNAGLRFAGENQHLTCEFCDNTFELDAVKAYNLTLEAPAQEQVQWEQEDTKTWSETEQENIRSYQCPSCGGEILTDDNTAATFCPYCDNPTIVPNQVSGGLKPDGVIPFKTTKEDAKAAFLKSCKGRPLLPKFFSSDARVEKISGMYVPFWLYDCEARYDGSFKATRIRTWSDSRYNYTKTDHYLLERGADAIFSRIPMDGSRKMDDAYMESIEPYDYNAITEFDMAYLTGYLAESYDIPATDGEERIRQRVEESMKDLIAPSTAGYNTVIPTSRNLKVSHSKASYILMPVWMLNTRYNGKIYTFAMNGQTGKVSGTYPVSRAKALGWFFGVAASVTALVHMAQMLI